MHPSRNNLPRLSVTLPDADYVLFSTSSRIPYDTNSRRISSFTVGFGLTFISSPSRFVCSSTPIGKLRMSIRPSTRIGCYTCDTTLTTQDPSVSFSLYFISPIDCGGNVRLFTKVQCPLLRLRSQGIPLRSKEMRLVVSTGNIALNIA